LIRAYAVASYLLFLASLLYVIGWLAAASPKGIDDGTAGPAWVAVLVDLALLGVFAGQHSVMARPWFKRAWTTVIPRSVERATYVLLSSVAVGLIAWQWRPLDQHVWQVAEQPWGVLLWLTYGAGWLIVLLSTVMIGHFELFGLTQALRGERYAERGFGRPGFYALVRHPIMTGFIVAFWATPDMTVGHLLFAAMSTAYIVVAVRFEEHDLRAHLGPVYEHYASEVSRFAPALRRPH
jgi:methanethiol S-methyltransferase